MEIQKIDRFSKAKLIQKENGSVLVLYKMIPAFLKAAKPCGRIAVNRSENMRTSAYHRTINRKGESLAELDLNQDNCIFITLTISHEKYNNYVTMLNAFGNFMQYINRYTKEKNNQVRMIRGIEVQRKSGFFHIHTVLEFMDKPPTLSHKRLRSYWTLGAVHRNLKVDVYDIEGLLQYLTKFKAGSLKKDQKFLTYFPKGAQIIYIDKRLKKAKVSEYDLKSAAAHIEANSPKIFSRYHIYRGKDDGKLHTVIDKIFAFFGSDINITP